MDLRGAANELFIDLTAVQIQSALQDHACVLQAVEATEWEKRAVALWIGSSDEQQFAEARRIAVRYVAQYGVSAQEVSDDDVD